MNITIRAGDHLNLEYTPCNEGVDLTEEGWECEVSISVSKGMDAEVTATLNTLNEDDTSFIGVIPSEDTAGLSPGVYLLTARVYNDDGQSTEITDRLLVRASQE